MSWEEETRPLSSEEQIELIAQAIDEFRIDYEEKQNELQQERQAFTKTVQAFNQQSQRQQSKQENEIHWIEEQKNSIQSLNYELSNTFKEREKKTVLVKKWLELAFYGVLVVIIYQALTTSLWHTLGFQELYKQVQQFKYGGLVVTVVYILLNILALVWLVKKLVKAWRY